MEVLDQRIQRRREIFDKYNEAFGSIEGFDFQPELPDSKSNRWLTALTIDESKTGFSVLDLIDALQQNNIEDVLFGNQCTFNHSLNLMII